MLEWQHCKAEIIFGITLSHHMLLDGVRVHELTPVKAIRVGVGLYKKNL